MALLIIDLASLPNLIVILTDSLKTSCIDHLTFLALLSLFDFGLDFLYILSIFCHHYQEGWNLLLKVSHNS